MRLLALLLLLLLVLPLPPTLLSLLSLLSLLCALQVYAVDLLGQGQSWPSNPECEVSGPLRLSADTWTEQLHHFIQVSLGGGAG